MEFIENIDVKEYEEFASKHNKAHFMQSCYWGEIQKNKNFIPHYVGVKKDSKLSAVALILEKKLFKNINYLYCPRGFVADYNDVELVIFFLNHIKNFAKYKKSIFFRMDPDLILNKLDEKAEIKEKRDNIYSLLKVFKDNGFKHKGFNKNFENNQPRYTFRLNLDRDWESIYSGFHSTTRKILNKKNPFSLNIYKGAQEDLEQFYVTMLETAKRENIIPSKLDYYKSFYTILNKKNMSDIYIVKADINNLKQIYVDKIDALEKDKEEIKDKNSPKSVQKTETIEKQINKLNNEQKSLNEIKEKEITLSSIITVKYNDMVWTVHGGNHTLLRELNANYLIYEKIIKDAHEENYKRIDFFGTTGDPKENNPVYGIYLFKKRLGGDYIEFIGEFDYVNNKVLYFLYTKVLPLIRKTGILKK